MSGGKPQGTSPTSLLLVIVVVLVLLLMLGYACGG